MIKIKDYLFLLLLVVLAVTGISLYVTIDLNSKKTKEIERLQSNQNALNDTVMHYLTKSGKYAASVEELKYSVKEFKKFHNEDMQVIKDLKLNLKQVESLIKVGLITTIHDTIPIRDTVINGDTVRCFKKFDSYLKLLGCARGDSVDLDISHTDTIHNIIHWTYKKWFIFKFKTDVVRLESINKSPYNHIYWNEYIKVTKK